MLKKLTLLLFIFTLYLLPLTSSFAVSYPSPQGYVSDYTDTLSQEFKTNLDNNLKQFEEKTTNEIAVVMINSLEGDTIENYAVRLFEQWKIGKKEKDNGLLLLIAKNDRKLRIEVGYGLEPQLTDAQAGDIIRNTISPEFKKGDYQTGILNGVTMIEKKLQGEALPIVKENNGTSGMAGIIIFLIILFSLTGIPLFLGLTYLLGRTKGILLGGLFGGVIGIIIGFIVQSIITALILTIILFIIGLLLDIICSLIYGVLIKTNKQSWIRGALHTWSTGGRWGSGSSGGGSSGGFGGGSSGGGGASGGW